LMILWGLNFWCHCTNSGVLLVTILML